tara:strand:- start:769 stop:945 length:177 start_codon:yes stop_codon:yes gene_type:complete
LTIPTKFDTFIIETTREKRKEFENVKYELTSGRRPYSMTVPQYKNLDQWGNPGPLFWK